MDVSALKPAPPTPGGIPIEKLAASKTLDEKQKIQEATRQFEAVLLRQILTEAHKPVFKSNLQAAGGVSSDIYKDMMISQLAEKISSSRAIGLAQSLDKQVTREPKIAAPKNLSDAEKTKTAPPIHPTKAKGL
jgi:Rod binding domain-containing protein